MSISELLVKVCCISELLVNVCCISENPGVSNTVYLQMAPLERVLQKASNYKTLSPQGINGKTDGGIDSISVSELVGWVRNVILINVYLDLENPGGVGISGGRVEGI